MTQPTLTVELGYLSGWTLGESLLGTDTYLATVDYSQDISDLVRSVSIRRGRQHELNRMEAGTASVVVLNQDGAMTLIPPMTSIRIRASFEDAPPFVPTDVAGLVAWYDFSVAASNLWQDTARTSPITADGQTIKGVTDKSGNGYHLSEATNGPTYKTAIKNGLSVSRFDGTNDVLQGPTQAETQPTTIIAVAVIDVTDAVNRQIIATENASTSSLGHSSASPGQWVLWNGAALLASAADTAWHIHVGISNNPSSKLYTDGGTATTGTSGTNAWSNWTVGSYADLSQFWDGDIAELIMYSTNISVADTNSLGAYLAAKWGITWSTAS